MHPQSSAYKLLVYHYRRVLRRMHARVRAARWQLIAQRREYLQIEWLQPRLMFSGSAPVGGTVAQVNATATTTQETPAVAMNPAGQYAIAWASASGSGWTVQSREYTAGGTAGTQIQVNQSPVTVAPEPDVALTNGGNLIVTWKDSGGQVFVREFNSSGVALSGQELVTQGSEGNSPPAVAAEPDGSFLVAWEGSGATDGDGIYAQCFTAAGLAAGADFLVNTASANQELDPSVAASRSGGYAAVWSDSGGTGSINGVTISAAGTTGSQFQVASGGGSLQTAAVAFDGTGNFDVAWVQANSGQGIYIRQYSAAGTPLAAASEISPVSSTGNNRPVIAARADGEFAVAWSDDTGSTGNDVFCEFFNSTGTSIAPAAMVNTSTAGDQQDAAVAFQGGNAVFAWDGDVAANPQTIYERTYAASQSADLAPANTVPGTQTININAPLTFSTANGNAISVSDADAFGASEQVTLTATNGTLTLFGTAGLTFTSGTGSGNATMTFAGTLANINASLAGLVFTPTANYTGSASLQVATNDLGNTGTGGPLTATNTISITVSSAAQPANNVVPGTQTAAENTPVVFATSRSNLLEVGSSWQSVQLTATNGKITLHGTAGLSFGTGTGTNDTTVSFTGTQAAMNAALNGMQFTPSSNFVGTASIAFLTSTSGLLGLGILGTNSTSNVSITYTLPPDQSPAVTVPAAQTVSENGTLTLSSANANAISVSDPDGGSSTESVTLTATSGTVTLGSTANVTISSGTGTNDASVTFNGTLAHLNAALNGLTFTPASNVFGTGGIEISINDQSTNPGGPLTAIASVPITISELPILAVNDPGYSAYENQTFTVPASGVLANDTDAAGNTLGAIQVSAPAHGQLGWNPTGLTGVTALTSGAATNFEPKWSPDGTRIAFTSNQTGSNEIYVMNADGTNVVQLTSSGDNIQPAWSPNGTKIVFYSDRTGSSQLWVMSSTGANQVQLTNSTGINGQPTWSPDGTKIVFASSQSGIYQLYIVNAANGSGLVQLTSLAISTGQPAWSPDGSKIAFVSWNSGTQQIYEISPTGTGLTQITNDSNNDSRPTWNPTDDRILFISDRNGSGTSNIYVMNADGTNAVQLTSTTAAQDSPNWSADGSKIVFESNGQVAVASLVNDGGFRYVPAAGYNGTDSFRYAAYDGTLTSNTATATITVKSIPTVATAARANPSPVTGKTTALSVLGADATGESNLTYSWATTGTPPAPVTFSANGNNTAKNTTATFTQAGIYSLQVTLTNEYGISVTSAVTVTVNQTPTVVAVAPATITLGNNATHGFAATVDDQFGNALATQPAISWTLASGTGTLTSYGYYAAPSSGNSTATVTASGDALSGSAAVTVSSSVPSITATATANPDPVTGATTSLSVTGSGSPGQTIYTWSATNLPAGAVAPTYSTNGTKTANNSVATFTSPGVYTIEALVSNSSTGLSTTTDVIVEVGSANQVLTSIVVAPATASLNLNATQQFTATGYDQYGYAIVTPPTFTWSVSAGVGSVSSSGLYNSGATPGSGTVKASAGTVFATASATVTNAAPTVATAAAASPSPVTGTTTALSVLGADDGGETNLTYTWATTGAPPAPVTFAANGTNAAKNTTATFAKSGAYNFKVTITDALGLSVTSTVAVTVNRTYSITVTPVTASLNENATKQFSAIENDQFGIAKVPQPTFTWSSSGVGTVSSSGLYTAPGSGSAGSATVTAKVGALSASASITVTNASPTVATPAAASPSPVTGTTTALSVLGADDGGEPNLTYAWATTGTPPSVVAFSANGTNAAKNTTATFAAAGIYNFQVTITDASGLTATSSVAVTVNQSESEIIALPSLVSVPVSTTQAMSAVAYDQFGNRMTAQPAFTWAASGGGSITGGGLYTAPATSGVFPVITATNGSYIGVAQLVIVASPANVVPPGEVTGTGSTLTVSNYSSSYDYTWSVASKPAGAPTPTFSANGTTTSYQTICTYYQAGSYLLLCNFGNPDGSGTRYCGSFEVTVEQTPTSIAVSPGTAALDENETQQFVASANDQFGNVIPAPNFTWLVTSGSGSVNSGGLFTAAASTGTSTVQATTGSISGTAVVSVANTAPTVATPAAASPSPVTGNTTGLSVLGADYGGEANLTYTWSTTGTPPAPVTFSANGTHAAKNATATFTKAGTYNFLVTITNSAGRSVTSSVSVVVKQTFTTIAVTPAAPSVEIGATQQFSAVADDQFGNALTTQPTIAWTASAGTINSSGQFTAPAAASSVTVTATSGSVSGSAPTTVTSPVLDFSSGFANATPKLTLNGSTSLNGTKLELVNSGVGQAGSAFSTSAVDVTRFRTWFNFQLTAGDATADGFTFTIQAEGPTALGLSGGGLGYGADGYAIHPSSPVITNSVAIKFDLANNAGEGPDSTGMYINGANPTVPAINLASTGIDLHSGDVFRTLISYDGSTLQVTIFDTQTGASASQSYVINIPQTVGATAAFVGFTGGDGGAVSTQDIQSWVFSPNTPVPDTGPTIATPSSASPSPVPGNSTNLSVLGADSGGESSLLYTWQTTGTPPALVTFSANNTYAAKNTTVTFTEAGTYSFLVTAVDSIGLSTTSSVTVTVNQTLTAITVTPGLPSLNENQAQQFAATGYDQFGNIMSQQPTFTWVNSGVGTVNAAGLYTAPASCLVGLATVTASSGSVSNSATVLVTDSLPTVATPASATPNPTTGNSAQLSVLGASDGGEPNLTYTWATTGTPPAAVSFSDNATNTAKNTAATFTKPGNYNFRVTIADASGLTTTSNVAVTVNLAIHSIAVTPIAASMNESGTRQFSAIAYDQFGQALASQPIFTWAESGPGSVSASGLYRAGGSGAAGSATVTASSGGVSGSAAVTVTNAAPTVATPAAASPGTVNGTTTNLSVLGADDGGASNLTFVWAAVGAPPAPVSFSANGTNSAKNTTATFSAAGAYNFQVTITDAGGLTAISSVSVQVQQTSTTVSVSPASPTVPANSLEPFTATLIDQFGNPMSSQPSFNWSLSGVGSVSNTGLYLAPGATGSAMVTATDGSFAGNASISITAPGPVDVPNGGETLVNTASTSGNQQLPAVAMDTAGNFVIVWEDGANGGEVNAQLYNAAGNAVGSQFQVNTASAGGNPDPSVAMNASGQFVVCWNGNGNTVYAKLFNNTGTALTGDTLVTADRQGSTTSTVAMAEDGTFAVAFEGNEPADTNGIYVQQFSSSGAASGSPVLINSTTQGTQTNPSITANLQGGYIVAWTAQSAGSKIKAAFFSASGVPSAEFLVGTTGSDTEDNASVEVDESGDFVISWLETGGTAGIFSRRYNAGGTPLDANPVLVTSTNITSQSKPAIAVRPEGTYLISWTAGGNQDGSGNGVFAEAFNPNGSAAGGQFLVNTTTQGNQQDAAVAWEGSNAVVAWDGQGVGDSDGVFFQNYATPSSAPTVMVPALASPSPATGTTTALSVLGADDDGESNLSYTWSAIDTPPAAVSFSDNGDNSAKNTTVTFATAGTYDFQVIITDAGGLSTSSSVSVTVDETVTSIQVAPGSASLNENGTQQFAATAYDQFGLPMATQPALAWSSAGVGSVNSAGLFSASGSGQAGSATVTAASGSVSGTASVTVTNAAPTVATPAAASPTSVTGTTAALSALGADDGGESNLTYTWATTGTPPAPVSFSANDTNSAKNATATFTQAGTYTFLLTITDAEGLTATSGVAATVNQTLTSVTVTPATAALNENGTRQFAATANDQFGLPMATQPAWTWSSTGVGSVSSAGLYSAPGAGQTGNATVTAASGAVSGGASVTVANAAPTVATPAAASPSPVTGTTAALSVLGADDGGESNLAYTWATTGTPPAAVSFSANGTNAAKDTTATFTTSGTYDLQVTITDAGGLTAISTLSVSVNQTLTAIEVSPATKSLSENATEQFAATAYDQFGMSMATQPALTWSSTGVGSIDGAGLYTAPGSGSTGSATITAASGSVSGSASVTVTNAPPTVATPASALPGTITGATTALSVLGADDGGESNLTYTWATTGTPPAAVSFSANGTNSAKSTTATFTEAGSYTLAATITDAGGLTVTSAVSVTVNQTLASISVTPASATTYENGQQQFSATAYDQFGNAMATQPVFTWTLSSGTGSVDSSGLYSAVPTPGPATVQAASGSVAGTATVTVVNQAPTIATPASASPQPVVGNKTALSVLGADDGAESNLTYTWAAIGPPPAAVTFSANGTNAARNTNATFYAAGNYEFQVTITDAGGLTATSMVSVTVNQTLSSIFIGPGTASLHENENLQFTAVAFDQFGRTMANPPGFTWSLTGAGSIDSTGFYSGPGSAGTSVIAASSGSISGNATVTITNAPPTIATPPSASPNPVTGTTVNLSVLGADDGGEPNLAYFWATTGTPPAPVTFSTNGTNAAKNTNATFSSAGTYEFTVTAYDLEGDLATSSVSVTVNQMTTSIIVSPSNTAVSDGGTQAFTAVADDQFGQPMAIQPVLSWSVSGAGNVDVNTGLYSAPASGHGIDAVTASGGGVSASTNVSVIAPPTVIVPAAQETRQGLPIVFSSASGNAISINDPSAGAGVDTVRLDATGGTMTLSGTNGLTLSAGTGTNDASVTFRGTLADINAALDGLIFTPASGFTGAGSISIQAADANYPAAGTQTTTASAAISVVPPGGITVSPQTALTTSASGQTAAFSVVLDQQPTGIVTIALQSSDPAAGTTNVSTLTFSPDNWNVPQAVLITGHPDDAKGENIAYQIQLQPAISIDPAYAGVSGGVVNLTNFDSGPTITASPGASDYVLGADPVTVDPNLSIADPDNDLIGARLRIESGYAPGNDELSFAPIDGIAGSWQPDSGTLVLSGAASNAAWETALSSVTFDSNAAAALAGTRSVSITLQDEGTTSALATRKVVVSAPPRPAIVAPAQLTTLQDTPLSFSSLTQNSLAVYDPLPADATVQVTLTARKGSVTLASTSGLTFTVGSGTGDLTAQFTGTLVAVNAALAGVSFTPYRGYSGGAALTVELNDLGNGGTRTPQIAKTTVAIQVGAVLPPLVAPPPAYTPVPLPTSSLPSVPSFVQTISNSGGSGNLFGSLPGGDSTSNSAIFSNASGDTLSDTDGTTPRGPANGDKSQTVQPIAAPAQKSTANPLGPKAAAASASPAPGPAVRTASGGNTPVGVAAFDRTDTRIRTSGSQEAYSTAAPAVITASSPMWHEMDEMHKKMTEEAQLRLVAGTASFVSAGASVLYVVWMLRAGSLLGSLMSSMPAWRLVDPLPILDQIGDPMDSGDEESLQSMIDDNEE